MHDKEGKTHFPDHAQKSHDIWLDLFPESKTISKLMLNDMVLHAGCSEDICELLKEDFQLVANLCFSSVAELEANAEMFGGTESVSYKIKYKKLKQRIKQVLKFQKENQ